MRKTKAELEKEIIDLNERLEFSDKRCSRITDERYAYKVKFEELKDVDDKLQAAKEGLTKVATVLRAIQEVYHPYQQPTSPTYDYDGKLISAGVTPDNSDEAKLINYLIETVNNASAGLG